MNTVLKKESDAPKTVMTVSLIVFSFLFLAKILNFGKKILIGHLFGVSSVADAFFGASHLPYYVAILFEGMIFLSILPTFSRIKSQEGDAAAHKFVRDMFYVLLAITLLTFVIMAWAAPWAAGQLVPGFKQEYMGLTVNLFRIMSFVVVSMSLCAFFQALNSYHKNYWVAASAGLMDTLLMISITLVSYRVWGIYGAAWGSVFGTLFAFLGQITYFSFKGPKIFVSGAINMTWVKSFFVFVFPLVLIWSFYQIPLLTINRFSSGMWQGSLSAIVIAYTLASVPMGLVSHTVLISIFPSITKNVGAAEGGEHARVLFFQTLRGAFIILMFVGFMLAGFSRPLAALFFSGGEVVTESVKRIANSLACFGPGTFLLYVDLFMSQSLIAVRRTKPAIALYVTRAVLTYAICYITSTLWDYVGLSLGFTLALFVNLLICFPIFLRNTPYQNGWGNLWLVVAKGLVALAPVIGFWWLNAQKPIEVWIQQSHWTLGVYVGGAGLLLGKLYLIILKVIKVQEVEGLFENLYKGFLSGKSKDSMVVEGVKN